MSIKEVKPDEKEKFNKLALHPLQSWEWGEFRKTAGIEVVRLGKYENGKLVETAQLTIHPLPFTPWTVGYSPKGGIPSREMLERIFGIGKQYRCIFIKLEPNIKAEKSSQFAIRNSQFAISPSPHPLFTKYTFQLDLTASEEELLANMHPKTRYNIKVAQKHGVTTQEDNSDEAFSTYLYLLDQTTKRQRFYAHDERYHKLMWKTLKNQESRIKNQESNNNTLTAHLLIAKYAPLASAKPLILTAWILFLFNNILYYPYGASSEQFRNVMASNLIMWETIRFGKKHAARLFDMWGALGPDPSQKDPWYGFHRFKQGYGPKLVELVGSFDLVINPYLYRLYNSAYTLRQIFLKFKSFLTSLSP